jgi:exodeoxyribonuclease VII large subunit
MKQMNLDLKDIEEKTHQKMEAEIDVSGAEVVEQQGPRVYAVSQLNQVIRQLLEGQFEFLWIQGEVSNFKAHPSGHYYFSLKDKKAQISAVMFKGFNRHLKFKPKDGIEVLVRGKVSVYEQRGNYQILCETMEPLGAGSLQIAFEQLKTKLQKEGLFDEARKRSLPTFPEHVALVTAPSGAAIRDMLNVLRRRSRGLRITVIPAIVQGGQAPESIVKGIENANRLSDVDVIIIGRGGGSIEPQWTPRSHSRATG